MDRILLEVDDTVGKAYRKLSEKGKQDFTLMIGAALKKAANDSVSKSYNQLLDKAGAEAVRNGLTEEILEALLASDD